MRRLEEDGEQEKKMEEAVRHGFWFLRWAALGERGGLPLTGFATHFHSAGLVGRQQERSYLYRGALPEVRLSLAADIEDKRAVTVPWESTEKYLRYLLIRQPYSLAPSAFTFPVPLDIMSSTYDVMGFSDRLISRSPSRHIPLLTLEADPEEASTTLYTCSHQDGSIESCLLSYGSRP